MRVLGLIPARGGSKEIVRKNIRPLAGRPLIEYSITAGAAASSITRIVVSTEDVEIANVAKRCGADVPFMRPTELARDETPMLPVVRHAVEELASVGDEFDAIVLLQPTFPIRPTDLIDGCVRLLVESGADSVVSVRPVPYEYNPYWVYLPDEQHPFLRLSMGTDAPIPRRQDLPRAYHRDGAVYVVRRDVLIKKNSLYGDRIAGYISDELPLVNIDTQEDWVAAEALVARTRI